MLTSKDVVRHKLVGAIVDAYERFDNQNGPAPKQGSRKRSR